jgi:hypothetical protein
MYKDIRFFLYFHEKGCPLFINKRSRNLLVRDNIWRLSNIRESREWQMRSSSDVDCNKISLIILNSLISVPAILGLLTIPNTLVDLSAGN